MTDADEIFESSVRSGGDLAGVFEYDGDTSYFYLYRTGGGSDKVLDSIHVKSGRADFSGDDLEIRWTSDETKVGLLIRGVLWAVFDSHNGTKYGGNYRLRARPELPAAAQEGFVRTS